MEKQRKFSISSSPRRSDVGKRKKADEGGLSPLGEGEEGAFCSRRRGRNRGCWLEQSKCESRCWKKPWEEGEDPSPQGPSQGAWEHSLESCLAMPKLGVGENGHLGLDLRDS